MSFGTLFQQTYKFYPLFLTQVLQFEMGFQPQFRRKSCCTSIICTLYPFCRVVALHVFSMPLGSHECFCTLSTCEQRFIFVMFPLMCYESLVRLVFLFTYITICITFLVPWYIVWHLLIHLNGFLRDHLRHCFTWRLVRLAGSPFLRS